MLRFDMCTPVYVESSEEHHPEQIEAGATPVRDTESKGECFIFVVIDLMLCQ